MTLSTLIALLQDAPQAAGGTQNMIKLGSGVLAVILLGIIIFRRKNAGKKKQEEDF